jgi:septal ring factor EnvC (AmiA/AmiB activator)
MSKDEDLKMLLPTYALRAWLTALLGATERAREELNSRVESHEKEIARLRAQMQRSGTVITSLRAAIESVDNVLRRTRDVDVKRESPRTHSETQEQSQSPEKQQKASRVARASKPRKKS